MPRPSSGRSPPRRHRALFVALGVATLVITLLLLLETGSQPTGPAAAGSAHQTRLVGQSDTDPERAAIRSLATALADGGFSGDRALASALHAVAAQPAGAGRQTAARKALSLAQVLVGNGGITSGQYQDVESALRTTGALAAASSPATSTSSPPTNLVPGFHGHGPGPEGRNAPDDQG